MSAYEYEFETCGLGFEYRQAVTVESVRDC